MKLKELKKPTNSFNPDFSMDKKKNPGSFTFSCEICSSLLKINFQDQINATWLQKSKKVSNEELTYLKMFYNIGLANKSHEGGFPVFDKIECPDCQEKYFTYCGVIEFYNSLYHVQVQGIVKLEQTETE